ncbi:MAG: MATE family efflux transporter [Lachnospiraceae bacterium]|nr:MATE family efflux transporter [Lachnospiraceae bacterium]
MLREEELSYRQQIWLVIRLSIPAILAEISSIVMQYIDAAMVGSLGKDATASIGLVTSTTWFVGGLCISAAMGFSVQVAQYIGAKEEEAARNVLRQSLIVTAVFVLLLSTVCISISGILPKWLGGTPEVCEEASRYFLVYACALPAVQFRQLGGSMLQCSGDMKTPSILNGIMCVLDVVFNFFLIFPTRTVENFGGQILIYGAGLGVTGAALGTALSEVVIAVVMLYMLCFRSETMRVVKKGRWTLNSSCLKKAACIAVPMAFEHGVLSGAQIISTKIVSPLGTVSVAANSLAVTAESLCYMPGYGIAAAATTLVGQSIGARRKERARGFARLSVLLGAVMMTLTAVLMFVFAPMMFSMLTPDKAVRSLGVRILRIEAFAEPLFACSIVAAGALRGAGDTLVPSVMNLLSMWGIRITMSAFLAPHIGLTGVWIAMCVELCIRGILFLIRLFREKWLRE